MSVWLVVNWNIFLHLFFKRITSIILGEKLVIFFEFSTTGIALFVLSLIILTKTEQQLSISFSIRTCSSQRYDNFMVYV